MSGTIAGTIVQARDLSGRDSGGSPYAIIGMTDAEGEFINKKSNLKTNVQKKTNFPVWGYDFSIELQPPGVALRVEIWDDNSHEFLGYSLIRDLKDGKATKKWYQLEARYGKKEKVKGEVEVSFTFSANQPPSRLNVHFSPGELNAVLWEKDKSIYSILSSACLKRGYNIDNFDVFDGTTKTQVIDMNITLGELWTTDITLEPKKTSAKKKGKQAKSEKGEKKRGHIRSALDGFVYGYVNRARNLGNKDSEGVKAVIGPVPSSNEYLYDNKKKKLIMKTKSIKDKNPEFATFFQFPVKPPVSALKLQILVESAFVGEIVLDEMPDCVEVKKTFNLIKKKEKTQGEVDIQYFYISEKSANDGKTHPYDDSSSKSVPVGQFTGYVVGARNLSSKESLDSFCLFGIIDDSDSFMEVNDDTYEEGEDERPEQKDLSTVEQNASRTKIQKGSSPEWMSYFDYSIASSPKGLKVEVCDFGKKGEEAFLGQVIIKNISEGVSVNDWFPLTPRPGQKNKVTGEIHLQFVYLSVESLALGKIPPFSAPTGRKKKKNNYEGPMLECEPLEGIIAGYVIRAKDLMSKDTNGYSDPYCIFGPIDPNRKYCFDDELHISMKEKTSTQFKTLNPVWKTYFEFKIKPPVCAFKLEIWDWDHVGQDDFEGEVIITNFQPNSEVKQWLSLGSRANSKDEVKGQIEVQYIYIPLQSLASGSQVPYDMAERKRLQKEKMDRDQIDKGDFTFLKVATYEAPNYEGDFFRTKLFTDTKWEDTFCVIFYDMWLIYSIPSKGIQPGPLTKPMGHVRLDRFNYKTIKQIENRVVSSGLIPKNERYVNTFAVGVGEKECLVECATPEDMTKWIEKVTNNVKNLLRGRKFLQTKNGDEILTKAQSVLSNPPVKPLEEGKEEIWMEDMQNAFENFRTLKPELKHISLFYRFNNLRNKDYINWFLTTPQEVEHPSLERHLQELEEKWLQNTWKSSFTNFTKVQEKLAVLNTLTLAQKEEVVEHCQRMITYIFFYNLYNAKLYKRKPSFAKAKAGWENVIQFVNNSIKEEKAAIKAKQEEIRQARMAEIQKQRELLENARKEYEAQLRDPFSETNMLNDNDDPFVDIVVDEVVDVYGEFVF